MFLTHLSEIIQLVLGAGHILGNMRVKKKKIPVVYETCGPRREGAHFAGMLLRSQWTEIMGTLSDVFH